MRLLLRLHGNGIKIRMSRKHLTIYYVQKNTIYVSHQLLRPRTLIEILKNKDYPEKYIQAKQPQQEMPEMPNRELLRDIAKKYMTLTKEELQEMTREYCSRIHTYRTKTLSLSGPSMTEQLQPVDSSENNDMEGKNVPRSEENFEQLQTSKIGKQGTYMLRKEKESELEDRIKVEEMKTERQTMENKVAELQMNRDKLKSEFMTVQTKYEELLKANAELEKELSDKQRELELSEESLENESQNYTSLLAVVKLLKEKNDHLEGRVIALETDKNLLKEDKRRNEEDVKEQQTSKNIAPQEFEKNVKLQTGAAKKRKEDVVQEYRKRNKVDQKQQQTLENNAPQEFVKIVKLRTSAEEERQKAKEDVKIDRDIPVVQGYRKRNEEYMKWLQTFDNIVPHEDVESVELHTSTPKERKTAKIDVDIDEDTMQEYRKQNEEYMKQLQTLTHEDVETVELQTSAPKERKKAKIDEDMDKDTMLEYRKQNEEYMKQLQTLANTLPHEDVETVELQTSAPKERKKAKIDVDMDKDLMQEYRKRKEEYMKQPQTVLNFPPKETEEIVIVQNRAANQRKMVQKYEEIDRLEGVLGKPKRPSSGYMLFVKDTISKNSNLRGKGCIKMVAEQWRTLDEKQKQVFEAKAEDIKASYETKLHNWEMEMIRRKNFMLVRRETLKKIAMKI